MTDGTVQETRMRFLSLCFCHRRFLQPRVKHKESFFCAITERAQQKGTK